MSAAAAPPRSAPPPAEGDCSRRTEALAEQAAALGQWHERWSLQRDALLAGCRWRAVAEDSVGAAQQAALLPLPGLLQFAHAARLDELVGGLSEARAALRVRQRRLLERAEALRDGTARRQSLARRRLAREREELCGDEERARLEERRRARAERARLEEASARAERGRTAEAAERRRLEAELQWLRERRWPLKVCAAVQTDAPTPVGRGRASPRCSDSESYVDDFMSGGASYEEDFDDASSGSDEQSTGSESSSSSRGTKEDGRPSDTSESSGSSRGAEERSSASPPASWAGGAAADGLGDATETSRSSVAESLASSPGGRSSPPASGRGGRSAGGLTRPSARRQAAASLRSDSIGESIAEESAAADSGTSGGSIRSISG